MSRSGPSPLSKLVGARVRALRDEGEITQAELAERAGWSVATVKRIEAGKMTLSVDHLVDVAAALKVTPAKLLARPPRDEDECSRCGGIVGTSCDCARGR